MRTFEEIKVNVDQAVRSNNAEALLGYATELDVMGTPQAEAAASSSRGWVQFLRGDHSSALEHYDRALSLYEELGDRKGVASVTSSIGIVHKSTGNYPAALSHYHRALALIEELGDRSGVARVTGNIGVVLKSSGDYPAALSHFHCALAIHEELGDRKGAARVSNNIGSVYRSTGDYPAALEHYHRALALHEEQVDRSGVASVTNNIGIVHFSTGDYPAALLHYHRALALHEELGDRQYMAGAISNIGSVHASTGDYPAAFEHLHRALALYEVLGERSGVALVTGNIVAAYVSVGSNAEAQVLLQAMDAMQIDDPVVRIQREGQRATLQQRSGDLDGAAITLQHALAEAKEHGLRSHAADMHKALRDLAQKRNDFAAYIEHNNEFTRITEEINGKEATLKMAMQAKQRDIDANNREHEKHMAVLHSTLPKHIADRVARGEVVNDHFENASVIFLDVVGFTELSSNLSSQDLIALLDEMFTQFDAISARHNVTKIKTIGDSYMCVSFDSVISAALCALDFLHVRVARPSVAHQRRASASHEVADVSHEVAFRIGIHCGPVVAGVLGTERMQYDVWGDTVNVASRMESSGEAGRVHVSAAFAANLKSNTEYRIQNSISESENTESHEVSHASVARPSVAQSELVTRHLSLVTQLRGSFDIKGKGMMKTYWLEELRSMLPGVPDAG